MRIPDGLYFSREHEWVKVEGSLARVGITDYAQDELGDIVYVEFRSLKARFRQEIPSVSLNR